MENTGPAAITRNVESLAGDLAATTAASGGTVLQLTNLHGDVTLQLPLDAAVAPTVLAADEYGNPRPGTPATRSPFRSRPRDALGESVVARGCC